MVVMVMMEWWERGLMRECCEKVYCEGNGVYEIIDKLYTARVCRDRL